MVLMNVFCFKEERAYVTVCGNSEAAGIEAAICVNSLAMLLVSACSGSMPEDGCKTRHVRMNEVPKYHTSDWHPQL